MAQNGRSIVFQKMIYPLLGQERARFIVVEEWPSGSVGRDWLRDELKGDGFIERGRIPLRGGFAPRGASSWSTNTDAWSPERGAEIDLRLPLAQSLARPPTSDTMCLNATKGGNPEPEPYATGMPASSH